MDTASYSHLAFPETSRLTYSCIICAENLFLEFCFVSYEILVGFLGFNSVGIKQMKFVVWRIFSTLCVLVVFVRVRLF